jgi:hypothetical protein
MTVEEFRIEIRIHAIREHGSMQAMADAINLSRNNLYGSINGRNAPSKKILDEMGVKKVISYSF